MKAFKGMIIFFVLTVVSSAVMFGLQTGTAYRIWATALLIAFISLILSFILSIYSLAKYKDYHRTFTLFILVCTSLVIIFIIIVLIFITFFLNGA